MIHHEVAHLQLFLMTTVKVCIPPLTRLVQNCIELCFSEIKLLLFLFIAPQETIILSERKADIIMFAIITAAERL